MGLWLVAVLRQLRGQHEADRDRQASRDGINHKEV